MSYGLTDLGKSLVSGAKSVGSWFSKGENLKGLGSAAVAAGGLYNDYQQSKYAKELLKLNKAQYSRGIAREDKMDANLNEGYEDSALAARRKKKNQPLVALG